jgi:hypothetical protein
MGTFDRHRYSGVVGYTTCYMISCLKLLLSLELIGIRAPNDVHYVLHCSRNLALSSLSKSFLFLVSGF